MAKDDYDALIANKLYPEAAAIFAAELTPVSACLANADFVLDTNVLLLPYGTGSDTLKQIRSVYEPLARDGRLFVPGQVAREFAKWRPRKLADLVARLENARTQTVPPLGNYPLLEELAPFSEARAMQTQMAALRKKMSEHLLSLLDIVRSWSGNDPVSKLYRDLFKGDCIVDRNLDEINVKNDFAFRMAHGIPPGNKDATKDDGGIGDYLIWLTILDLGRTRKRPLIFVSGDDKADWRYQANKKGIYPRFELVDEFRRASEGQAFHILHFSEFLYAFDTPEPIVVQVEDEERRLLNLAAEIDQPSIALQAFVADEYAATAVRRWLEGIFDVVESNRRFPDFICAGTSGNRVGVEILAVQEAGMRNFRSRMHERLRRATSVIGEGTLDEFLLVVVALGVTPATVIDAVTTVVSSYDQLPISVVVGTCDRGHRFEPIYP